MLFTSVDITWSSVSSLLLTSQKQLI
jgi:hypothetical protein